MAVLVPSKPVFPYTERLVWRTQIVRAADGSEQRISMRKVPRQQVGYTYPVRSDGEMARLDNLLYRYAKLAWYIALWGEQVHHTATLVAGATSISVNTATGDFRASGGGNYVVIWQSSEKYEVATVSALTSTTLTVSALVNTYAGSKWIVPCRTGYLLGAARKRRYATGTGLIDITFEIIDNQYVTGHSAATTYDDVEVLTTPAYVPGGIYEHTVDADSYVIDSGTGRRVLDNVSDFVRQSQTHQFVNRTASDCWSFRKWLHAINGPQKTFFVPTFRNDLTLAAACLSSATSITVVNGGFADYLTHNLLRDYVAFRPSGASIIVRRVESMAEVDADTETITIDAAPGVGFSAGEHLCWVDRCRLAADEVEIQWIKPGLQIVTCDLMRVENIRPLYGENVYGMGVYPG